MRYPTIRSYDYKHNVSGRFHYLRNTMLELECAADQLDAALDENNNYVMSRINEAKRLAEHVAGVLEQIQRGTDQIKGWGVKV